LTPVERQPPCQNCPNTAADLLKQRSGRSAFGTGRRLVTVQRCSPRLNAPTPGPHWRPSVGSSRNPNRPVRRKSSPSAPHACQPHVPAPGQTMLGQGAHSPTLHPRSFTLGWALVYAAIAAVVSLLRTSLPTTRIRDQPRRRRSRRPSLRRTPSARARDGGGEPADQELSPVQDHDSSRASVNVPAVGSKTVRKRGEMWPDHLFRGGRTGLNRGRCAYLLREEGDPCRP
jgi:hypothetical protein